MRIYAAADIHGKQRHIDTLFRVIDEKKPNILIIPGDITHYFSSTKAIEAIEKIPIPIFALRGNWDFKKVDEIINRKQNIHLITPNPMNINGFDIVGTGGTVSFPFLSKIKLFEQNVIQTLSENITKDSILVVHPPPRGILDRVGKKFSAGSFGVKELIDRFPPKIVLCGHIHEQSGFQYYRDTLVVNCAMNKTCGGVIIEYDKNRPPQVEMIKTQSKR